MADAQTGGGPEQSRLELEHPIAFLTLTGETLDAVLTQVALSTAGDGTACRLRVRVSWDVYQVIASDAWMGLHATFRLQGQEAALEAGRDVELRVVLRHTLLTTALRFGIEAEHVLQALLEDSLEGQRLRCSECWLITEALQQLEVPAALAGGTLKKGYRTQWAADVQALPVAAKPSLHETVESYMAQAELDFDWLDGDIGRCMYSGANGSWAVLIRTDEAQQLCLVYSVYPVSVPEAQRAELAVYLNEENYDLVIGNFELDPSDGELRYRTSLDVEQAALTPALFQRLFTTNVEMMDYYFQLLAGRI
ncbi:YbjN domain-containing protein [Paenibacillus whitsoniae]|uniref:YbjN domain-containing protein n=1 Tax=Paenibacillus whitsoniae TaxID=2496558 RepID=A0A430J5L5_9BACL|nr:YbjN domain-containing protein [Paenibacillus whitsoniae]RTE03538.1 YbjN domain-containing protein [Paenibacillus whitsoniae]